MDARLMRTAALAAGLTVPLVLAGFVVFYPDRVCDSPGPPCPTVLPDPDGPLWRAAIAAAVVELLIIGVRAVRLRASRHATLVAVAVVALAVSPITTAPVRGLAVVSFACPLVVFAVRRTGGRGAGIAVLGALLPSVIFLVLLWAGGWDYGLGLATGVVVLFWLVSVPVALVAPRSQARVDRL